MKREVTFILVGGIAALWLCDKRYFFKKVTLEIFRVK